MSLPVVLYGASELGRDAVSVFHALESAGRPRRVLGFVDDGGDKQGRSFLGVPVLGTGAWLEGKAGEVEVLLTVGAPRIRRLIATRLASRGHRFATVVHPSVTLTPWVQLAEGVLVMAGCTFTVEITVGAHAVLNPGCTVAHDVRIGAYAYLSPGVDLAGRVAVEEGAYLGVGACVIPSCTVGAGAYVGAGSVVTRDVPPDRVAAGVPARAIKPVEAPWAV